ncbi:MAG: hypothetical protein IJJ33_08305 [Victivallales bacterium]|nr:hypothetical protein [Victivallales bacterium]
MKKTLALLSIVAGAALAVTLEEKPDSLTVQNQHYTLQFAKENAYAGRLLTVGKAKIPYGMVTPVIYLDGELDNYERRYNPGTTQVARSQLAVTAKVLESTPTKVSLQFAYTFPGGRSTEVVECDDTPAVLFTVGIDHTVRLYGQQLNVGIANTGNDGIFLPDNVRVTGVYHANGEDAPGPGWRLAWYARKGVAVGVVALPHPNLSGIEYAMQGRDEGWSQENANLQVIHNPLSRLGKTGKLQFRSALLACAKPDEGRLAAEKLLGAPQGVRFFSAHLQKVTTRPGQPNTLLADVRNYTGKAVEATINLTLTYSLDSVTTLPPTSVTFPPNSAKVLELPIHFPADVQRGCAVRCELRDQAGAMLDSMTDFCSVTDFAPRDAGFGIINVQQAHQDGSQHAWNRSFRKKYIGAYEYYCWAPSTIFGLAPKEESWIPHTEANYTCTITKKFLKRLVDDAHSQGIGVYAWVTGLWNYKVGLQHPELLQYTANGQPNIYNGTVWKNGHRRMVLKPNMFTVERARMWGEEMADSVDMFGWDGCRWDWTFVPSVMNDPMYMGERTDDWYDWKGVPQSRLYPDPDKTAVECLQAWREAVARRHPDFIFGTNYGSSLDTWKDTPRWHALAATRSMVLFEDMLNYARAQYGTFESWGSELAIRCDKVREWGGTPVVGAMHGLPESSVSSHLAHYTAAAAGVKWWCYGGNIHIHDRDGERNRFLLRFAEWYYGTEYLRPATIPVSLAGSDKVLYKPFVRERRTADGRELVVPLLNCPEESAYVCQFHDTPPTRSNLELSVPSATAEVWLMTPQSPEKARKLPVTAGKVSLPSLVDTALLLIRVREQGGVK